MSKRYGNEVARYMANHPEVPQLQKILLESKLEAENAADAIGRVFAEEYRDLSDDD